MERGTTTPVTELVDVMAGRILETAHERFATKNADLFDAVGNLARTCRGARHRLREYRSALRDAMTPVEIYVDDVNFYFRDHVGRYAVYTSCECYRFPDGFEYVFEECYEDESEEPVVVQVEDVFLEVPIPFRSYKIRDVLRDRTDSCFLDVRHDESREDFVIKVERLFLDLDVVLRRGSEPATPTVEGGRCKSDDEVAAKLDDLLRLRDETFMADLFENNVLDGSDGDAKKIEDWKAVASESYHFVAWKYGLLESRDVSENEREMANMADRLFHLVFAMPPDTLGFNGSCWAKGYIYSQETNMEDVMEEISEEIRMYNAPILDGNT